MAKTTSGSNGRIKRPFASQSRAPAILELVEDATENTGEDLVYSAGPFTVRVSREGNKWKIAVLRGENVLGIDTINLADHQGRQRLLRGLIDVNPEEKQALAKFLLRLATQVDADWHRHDRRAQERAQRLRQEQVERETAEAEKEQRRWLRKVEPLVKAVLTNRAMLYQVGKALRRRGLVGERANGLLLYLAVLSQITDEPISVVVKGDSSGGKSHLVKQVLELVPAWAHFDLTSMSEKSLIYDPRSYAHRTIIFFEVNGEGGEFTSYLIRTLISERQIRGSSD
jgi:hypothetical protein